MTTPTDDHLRIARETGYAGVEVRAERLLGAPGEVAAAAEMVRAGEVWSLNGIQLQVMPEGRLDRERLTAEMAPRLDICRAPRGGLPARRPASRGGRRPRPVDRGDARWARDPARRGAPGDRIRIAFEFLGFGDCPIDTPELAGRVVADLPGVELVLDSCHWHASGSGSLDAFPIDRLAMVHLNDAPAKPPREIEDADRVLPGRGVIRLAALIEALARAGYRGPWSLETFNPEYWARPAEEIAAEGRSAVARILDAPPAAS